MSTRDWTGAVIGVLALAGTLAAQPDPIGACRNRVSVAVNAPVSGIHAVKRGGLDNGNYIIWWDAKLAGARTVSGFCEANPLTGRIVRLGPDVADSNGGIRAYRITPVDAERVCRQVARETFNPGGGMFDASFLRNVSTKRTYKVEWQYHSLESHVSERPLRHRLSHRSGPRLSRGYQLVITAAQINGTCSRGRRCALAVLRRRTREAGGKHRLLQHRIDAVTSISAICASTKFSSNATKVNSAPNSAASGVRSKPPSCESDLYMRHSPARNFGCRNGEFGSGGEGEIRTPGTR